MHLGNFQQVHRGGSGTVVDTQDTDKQEGGAAHQHQCQLHGGVLLASRPPYTDKQIHGNEGNLVEHEHGEQVGRDEEPEHTRWRGR